MKVISLYKDQSHLIERAQNNNREAQQELFEAYSAKMLGVCRQYIKDLQFAEEVMLNGFLKVFINLKKFESKGSFEGWIRRIMVNESISFLRKKKRLVFVNNDTYFETETTNQLEEASNVSELQHLIDNLQDDFRIVFNLFVIEGYKHKEIAVLLKIPEQVSRMRFYRARKQLQKQYAQLKKKENG